MTNYLDRLNDIRLTKDFKLSEFVSRDTGEVKIYPSLLIGIQGVRSIIKKPVIITSGYRTWEKNIFVGGEYNSLHRYGLAVDVVINNVTKAEVRRAATVVGFTSIRYYPEKGYWHLGYNLDQRTMDLIGGDSAE